MQVQWRYRIIIARVLVSSAIYLEGMGDEYPALLWFVHVICESEWPRMVTWLWTEDHDARSSNNILSSCSVKKGIDKKIRAYI